MVFMTIFAVLVQYTLVPDVVEISIVFPSVHSIPFLCTIPPHPSPFLPHFFSVLRIESLSFFFFSFSSFLSFLFLLFFLLFFSFVCFFSFLSFHFFSSFF